MSDYNGIIKVIKQAATEAGETTKPVAILFGRVTKVQPLEIFVDQKLVLKQEELVLTEKLKEMTVQMTTQHETGTDTHSHSYTDDGSTQTTGTYTHTHAYQGKKGFLMHSGLQENDKVILLRVQGGQKFIVLDRIA